MGECEPKVKTLSLPTLLSAFVERISLAPMAFRPKALVHISPGRQAWECGPDDPLQARACFILIMSRAFSAGTSYWAWTQAWRPGLV